MSWNLKSSGMFQECHDHWERCADAIVEDSDRMSSGGLHAGQVASQNIV